MDLARYAIHRPSSIWLLILLCVLGGVFGYLNVNRLEDPEFAIKEAVVITPYPGADALQVEREVTDVLEAAIQRMPQVDEVRSRSTAGQSEIRVQLHDRYRGDIIDQAWDELRNRVADTQARLPPGVGASMVNDDFGDVYGIFYAMTGEGLTPAELHQAAKDLRRGLVTTPGVGGVEISGVQSDRFIVEIPQSRLAALSLSPQEIAQVIEGAQTEVRAGALTVDGLRMRLSPTGAYDSVETLRLLPLGVGQPRIRLGDVASIRREPAEQPTQIIRYDGRPAIALGISGQSAVNIVDVGRAVDARLAELRNDIPAGIELHPIYHQPSVVESSVDGFVISLLVSLLIVAVCLCFAMGWKAGATTSSILLLSIGGTLFVMYVFDIELERVSLAALIIAMGMLVDNALVVCDGIQVRLKRGQSALQAARHTLTATQWPLLGATIIGILAFAGVGLSDDQSGEFLFSLFIVILISLMLSWVLAVTVVPMLAYYWLARPEEKERLDGSARSADAASSTVRPDRLAAPADGPDPAFSGRVYDGYRAVLKFSLRHSALIVVATIGLTGLSVIGFANLPQSFFPPSATPIGLIDMHTRSGSDIRLTNERAAELEAVIMEEFEEVRAVARMVGQGGMRFVLTYAPQQPDPSYAQLMLLVDDANDLDPIIARINREMPDRFPDLEVHGLRLVFGANPVARVEARFSGPDATTLRTLSEEAQAAIRSEGTLVNVRDNWRHRELVLRPQLDLERMAEAGVTRQAVGQALLAASEGMDLGVLVENEEQRPIVLRTPPSERPTPETLLDTLVWSPSAGRHVPLRQIADSVRAAQVDEVIHRHNRMRVIAVRGEPPVGMEAAQARDRIVDVLEAIDLPPGYSMEWGGVHENSSGAEGALLNTIAVPYLVMFGLTILMFASFRHAVAIWLVVPMSIIGVVLGLTVTGVSFSFLALFGVLSLTGLLLKNAIVLVEEIESQVRSGKLRTTAIIEGSTSRLLPIVLLAVTTILGMSPLLLDPLFVSLAITLMGGLGVSVVLSLVVVPCLYNLIIRPRGRVHAMDEEGAPA